MKKKCLYGGLLVGLFYCSFVIMSCSKDSDSEETSGDLSFSIGTREGGQEQYMDWGPDREYAHLKLYFGNNLNSTYEWTLSCDAPWLLFVNTRGKAIAGGENIVTYQVEPNENNDDRQAVIYMDVAGGYPYPSTGYCVVVRQYGYEHYFELGYNVSFDTDRSLANSDELKLSIINFQEVLEVDWGDGNKEFYNSKSSRTPLALSHRYNNKKSYKVTLRFGGKEVEMGSAIQLRRSSVCMIPGKQGIATFYENGRLKTTFANVDAGKVIRYNDQSYKLLIEQQ